jgi:hypothetical protein
VCCGWPSLPSIKTIWLTASSFFLRKWRNNIGCGSLVRRYTIDTQSYCFCKPPPYTQAGFDLTTHSSSVLVQSNCHHDTVWHESKYRWRQISYFEDWLYIQA